MNHGHGPHLNWRKFSDHAAIMADDSYKQSHGLAAQLPLLASDNRCSVVDMVTRRIDAVHQHGQPDHQRARY